MKCLVSICKGGYKNRVWFSTTCNSAADTYEVVSAILESETLIFPNTMEAKNNYLDIIVGIFSGRINAHENCVFKIEKID